jgi:hypothetical protein
MEASEENSPFKYLQSDAFEKDSSFHKYLNGFSIILLAAMVGKKACEGKLVDTILNKYMELRGTT